MPESSDEADTPLVHSEPYAMGLAFSADLVDTLLSTVFSAIFYYQYNLESVHQLFVGSKTIEKLFNKILLST